MKNEPPVDSDDDDDVIYVQPHMQPVFVPDSDEDHDHDAAKARWTVWHNLIDHRDHDHDHDHDDRVYLC